MNEENINWRSERKKARNINYTRNINGIYKIINYFLNNKNPLIREGLIDNPTINKELINKLLHDKSSRIKEKIISKYNNLAEQVLNDTDWKVRYLAINNNFNLSKDTLKKFAKDKDIRIQSKANNMLNILSKYIYRKDFDNAITIKLVIPNTCNANCCFCYGKGYSSNQENLKELFLQNFLNSLEYLILKIDNKQPISLDITGGEPTLDADFLIEVLKKLRSFYLKDKINRITITTNGYHLKMVLPEFKGVIDYVNISVHHYDYNERGSIFRQNILNDEDYKDIILKLIDMNIPVSAVCVLYKQVNNFEQFRDNFIAWAKDKGFVSIRFRKNVFWKDNSFLTYMNDTIHNNKFITIQKENTPDSNWCHLCTEDGFFIYFLQGVEDVSQISKGIEFVIHNDGEAYADFNKVTPIDCYRLPIGYIFDKIQDK